MFLDQASDYSDFKGYSYMKAILKKSFFVNNKRLHVKFWRTISKALNGPNKKRKPYCSKITLFLRFFSTCSKLFHSFPIPPIIPMTSLCDYPYHTSKNFFLTQGMYHMDFFLNKLKTSNHTKFLTVVQVAWFLSISVSNTKNSEYKVGPPNFTPFPYRPCVFHVPFRPFSVNHIVPFSV